MKRRNHIPLAERLVFAALGFGTLIGGPAILIFQIANRVVTP